MVRDGRRLPLPRNQRLHQSVYTESGRSCFFTVRADRGTSPFLNEQYAAIAVECLLAQQAKSGCRLDVYCVMPDHLHVIVTPLTDGASSLLYVDRFKGWCGRRVRLSGWQGTLWQPRSYDHVIRSDERVEEIATYILHNPVRRGLCESPEEYPWSGMAAIYEWEDDSTIRNP